MFDRFVNVLYYNFEGVSVLFNYKLIKIYMILCYI